MKSFSNIIIFLLKLSI